MSLAIPVVLIIAVAVTLRMLLAARRPSLAVVTAVLIVLLTLILTVSHAPQYLEPVLRVVLGR